MKPKSPRLISLLRSAAFALLVTLSCSAAEKEKENEHEKDEKAKDGFLNTYLVKEPDDTKGQLELLQMNVFKLQVDTTLMLFHNEYGDRVHVKRVWYPANTPDHDQIPAYMFTPQKREPGKKYPALVVVHGGLHNSLDWRQFPLIAEAVEHGYVVIFPEYHGSTGYADILYVNSYGHTDVADVIAAADYFAKQDFVDPTRMGLFGHSRGGMVTVLAIERYPQRFQAAVEVCGLMDFLGYMSYKPDSRRREIAREPQFHGKLPSKDLPAYMEITPLNYVKDIQTPLLALGTTGDKIVPVVMNTGRLIELLEAHHKVYEGHVYDFAPGGHQYIEGDNDSQRDSFKRLFEWFGKYLKP